MILEILRNLSLSKIQILIRILDGCMLFLFISILFTSIIINIKNRNGKSMLISLIFIIVYAAASAGVFFGITILNKLGIPLTNTSYYIEIGIFAIIQIAMIVLLYIWADPYAREKKIEHMKETGEYYELLKKKEAKKIAKQEKKKIKKAEKLEKGKTKNLENKKKLTKSKHSKTKKEKIAK